MPGKGSECVAIATRYCPIGPCSREPARWPVSKSDQFSGGSWSLLAIRLKAMRFAAVQIAWRSAGANPFSRLGNIFNR